VLTKIHHAVIDGMSGAEILGLLLDVTPEGRTIEAPAEGANGDGGQAPGQAEMVARGLMGLPKYPLRVLRALPGTLPNAEDAPAVFGAIPGATTVGRLADRAQRVVRRDLPSTNRRKLSAPKTPFNGRVSRHRRFTFGQLSLDEVKAVKNAHGVTVNDVVVSICAGAVRRWLEAHDALPDEPLVAQIPVSVRTEDQFGTYGNRILLLAAPLFTDEGDPVARLQKTHEAMVELKQHHKALPAGLLQDANHFIPPAVFARAAQLSLGLATTRVGRPNWNLVISNVPGPQFPLYLLGREIEEMVPLGFLAENHSVFFAIMSYNGRLDIGLLGDRDAMADLEVIGQGLVESLAELKDAAGLGATDEPAEPARIDRAAARRAKARERAAAVTGPNGTGGSH
jgi:WS/DGAT/MGAT family acyltransferase